MKKRNLIVGAGILVCLVLLAICWQKKPQTVEEIVANMTLQQKIGQKIMPAFRKWTDADGNVTNVTELNSQIEQAMLEYGFGGVILFRENVADTQQTANLIYDLKNTMTQKSATSHIPLLVAIDQEGGTVVRLTTGTNMCGNMALGANGNPEDTTKAAEIIGSELYALGINMDFAPDMDVNNNPANPVIGIRSFSSQEDTVSEFGSAYIKGIHNQQVATAVKHFPGHGNTSTDSHTGLPCITKTYEELKQCELIPFQSGIEAGTDVVMTAHIQFPNIETVTYCSLQSGEEVYLPATLSKTIITDILRDDMGFQGVVVTDAMAMDAINVNFAPEDAAKYAINAGVDILLMPVDMSTPDGITQMRTYIDAIVQMVQNGQIEEETINQSVKRILTLKKDRGILDADLLPREESAQKAKSIVGSREHHDVEWEITKKAITMVKNNEKAVPISAAADSNIALFCPYENEVNSMEFAIQRLKEEETIPQNTKYSIHCYNEKSVKDFENEIKSATSVLVSVEAAKAADMNPQEESGWQSVFVDELISTSHQQSKQVVLISAQLPYDAARYQKADAILLAYCAKGMPELPTQESSQILGYGPNLPAAVCIAFGEDKPMGRLPVDLMELNEKYEYTDKVLYPRGFGLME